MDNECPDCGELPDHNGECGCPCSVCGEFTCTPDCDCVWCDEG
jgi:hypothetical protein